MTNKRLNELKNKFSKGEGNIQELGEVLTDLYSAIGRVANEIKTQNIEIKTNQEILFEEIQKIKELMNPVFTIVNND